jgi:hypothetical protein
MMTVSSSIFYGLLPKELIILMPSVTLVALLLWNSTFLNTAGASYKVSKLSPSKTLDSVNTHSVKLKLL